MTSRRVAAEAGLKPQLVHYYFATMDDLFLAVFRRRAAIGLERQAAALASDDPIGALWEFSLDPAGTALSTELNSLANHRKAIRAEIAQVAEQLRAMQSESIATVFEAAGIDPEVFPPDADLAAADERLARDQHGEGARHVSRSRRSDRPRRTLHHRPPPRSVSVPGRKPT